MKRILTICMVGILLAGPGMIFAQQMKFGHINSRELLASMPESDSAQVKLEKLAQDYDLQNEEMQVELNKKYDEYINNRDNYTDLIRQSKEADIQDLQNRINNFQQMAQQDLQEQQGRLMQPILEKANQAVKDVAQENGFIYIFDVGSGNPVFWSEQSVDILPLVKTKLGI